MRWRPENRRTHDSGVCPDFRTDTNDNAVALPESKPYYRGPENGDTNWSAEWLYLLRRGTGDSPPTLILRWPSLVCARKQAIGLNIVDNSTEAVEPLPLLRYLFHAQITGSHD